MRLQAFWQLYSEATQLRTGGQLPRAVERYRAALQHNPAHEDSLYYLASCLAELGDYKEAVQLYEKLVALNSASHRGNFQLGVTLSTPVPGASLDFSRARQAFTRNVEINKEESGPFLRLGELALYEGKIKEAQEYFDTAAGFQSPEGMFRAGFVRYLRGDFSGARNLFLRVLEINAHEKKISGRGVHSEGDIQSSSTRFTPLESAGIQALVYLYWTCQRLGGYPAGISSASRIAAPKLPTPAFEFVPFRLESSAEIKTQDPIYSVRDSWTKDWKRRPEGSVVRSIAADLDRDGNPERIEVSNNLNSIRVVWNDGRTTEVVDCSAPVVDLTVLDFDGDGYSDLAALEWKAGLRLVRNNGRRGFEDVTSASGLRTNVTEAFAVASLDYDRDGRPDLLLAPYPPYMQVLLRFAHPTAEPSPYSLRLFRNVGEGHFLEVQGIHGLAEVHGVMRAIPADFDRDGFTDILLACGGLDNFRLEPSVVLRNEQGKSFAIHAYLPSFDNPLRVLGAEVRDLDGDGNPDIRLRTPDGIRTFRNVHR